MCAARIRARRNVQGRAELSFSVKVCTSPRQETLAGADAKGWRRPVERRPVSLRRSHPRSNITSPDSLETSITMLLLLSLGVAAGRKPPSAR